MKQGHTYTNIILGLFIAAVVCYFGYYLYSANYEPLRTVTAIEYEAGSGCYTTGFVVRDETVIAQEHEITALSVSEGDRVASGQTIAIGYESTDAQDRQNRIAQVEHELEQLDYAQAFSSDASEQAELEAQIETNLQAMSQAVARRDMNACVDRSAAVKGLVLRWASSEEDLADLTQRIAALQAERNSLMAQAAAETDTVASPGSGSFSGSVDGFETVLTPAALPELTVKRLQELKPDSDTEGALGKLIHGSTWYYVTAVDAGYLSSVRLGDRLPVSFSSSIYEELPMKVEQIGKDEDGKQLLVLSCDRFMQEVTLLREQSATVVFSSCSGLRVPKEAIRVTEDRRTGVYVLEAGAAEWKYVTLLHDNGESYVVELDKSSTDNLWPGDEVLITAEELYDGKVVVQG